MVGQSRMKNEYLGACLDYVRWGGQTTVMYEMSTLELIDFILEWMVQNRENLIWHPENPPEEISLPYIDHKNCPVNKDHKGRIKDIDGRIRCAHKVKEIGSSRDERCYAIISDKGCILPLEEILDRLNLENTFYIIYCIEHGLSDTFTPPWERAKCKLYGDEECLGHTVWPSRTIHPFDGWYLAWYVQKWFEQKRKPVLRRENHKFTRKMLEELMDEKDPLESIKSKTNDLKDLGIELY